MLITLWILQGVAPVENPPLVVWLGVVGPVLALTAAVVGKVSYDKGKAAGGGSTPASDAMVERNEGAFQERVGTMLTRLADVITAGNTAHRDELREISRTMRDASVAMRAVVDLVEPSVAASQTMLPLVRELHGQLPTRRRGRKRI